MTYLIDILHVVFPLLSLIFLLLSLTTRYQNSLVIALWLSLISLITHYQTAGGEILGNYFTYWHAFIYSLNIVILLTCVLIVLFRLVNQNKENRFRFYIATFFCIFLILGASLLLVNLWINACFIENRMAGTPILQVATLNTPSDCRYRYVFYKVNPEGSISFMCPNYYGFIPLVKELDSAPEHVLQQLPKALQIKFQSSPMIKQ